MSSDLLTSLLKEVSRSFYLTMRILPGAIRPQISLAYLLARATDTIADTEIVSTDQRLDALEKLRARISQASGAQINFGELARNQGLPAERILLDRCEEALLLLSQLSDDDQRRIRELLTTIIGGQELDLLRFGKANELQIVALQTENELDDYTYRVAGCVGEFWTHLCQAHLFAEAKLNNDFLIMTGVRFGKGLQLVNILRDLPRDLHSGRCYVPETLLNRAGLSPQDLLAPANEPKFRPVYNQLLTLAEEHLAAGWNYTKSLPRSEFRLRVACALPLLIGVKTIAKLRSEKILDPTRRIKISRSEVRNLLAKCILAYPFPKLWNSQIGGAGQSQECC